jgi:hypothetical protein
MRSSRGELGPAAAAILAPLLLACDDGPRPPAGQWTELLDRAAWQAAWQRVPAEADPLASHRPPQVVCSYERGYAVEDLDLELDTGACNYVALSQPVGYRLLAGDELRLVWWHYPLSATLPATAHAALLLDGEVLWQRDVPIPSPADLYDVTVPLVRALPPGASVGLHLHNHGANQWRVQPLLIRPR